MTFRRLLSGFLIIAFLACVTTAQQPDENQAKAFLKQFDDAISPEIRKNSIIQWAWATNITAYNEAAKLAADDSLSTFISNNVNNGQPYYAAASSYSDDTQRKLNLLKLNAGLPKDAKARARLLNVTSQMESIYSAATVCDPSKPGQPCMHLEPELSAILANPNSTYDERLFAWKGWRDATGPKIRDLFEEYVALMNLGARDWGYKDASAMWLAGYDMPSQAFISELERAWLTLKPLYGRLHCYVRHKLNKKYGSDKVPADGPIPAHLLGNMWAQSWGNIFDLVKPYPNEPAVSVDAELVKQGYNAKKMMELSESFYVSLGMRKLPQSFWDQSMIERPTNPPRDVVCHASAWDLWKGDNGDQDVRIKMCTSVDQEDLLVQHHELGHIYYYLNYKDQPYLYRAGANDGFHEAIGDTIRLSVTPPQHLIDIGLLPAGTKLNEQALVNYLMLVALDKIAFLPFGYIIDLYRWQAFQGTVNNTNYEQKWWELRTKYQGVSPPVTRSEHDFDPGSKYHVAASVPYLRYFLAYIYQFQFHEALCKIAGWNGPLHLCSIYNSKEAGAKFMEMLAMGASKPWQQALKALTGTENMDASALLRYFAPLNLWLQQYINENQLPCTFPDGDQGSPDNSRVVSIVIGVLIGVVFSIAALYWYLKRRANRKGSHYSQQNDDDEELAWKTPQQLRGDDGDGL